MSQPAWLKKYLTMKPEINKVFDDLDEWLDHCRFNLLKFDPADLYKSDAYKEWNRRKNWKPRHNNNRNDNRGEYNRGGNYRKFNKQ
jgi:hypothetical protein